MKKIKFAYIAGAALLGLSVSSCTGLLDVKHPTKETLENFYLTEEEAFQGLTAAYSMLSNSSPQTASGSYVNSPFEILSEILGDCCFAGGEGGAGYDQAMYRRSTFSARVDDNASEALWNKYYIGIYRCNVFFANIDRTPFKIETQRERYIAEAHFLRAYYYFDLVRLYGNVPLVLEELTPSEYDWPQASPEEVYTQIAADLLEAINAVDEDGQPVMYPDMVNTPSEMKGRATLAAAKALLARVWLYYTGYYGESEIPGVTAAMVRGFLTDIIEDSSHQLIANAYDLSNLDAVGVTPLWVVTNNNNAESVFEIQFSGLGKAGYGNRIDSRGNQAVLLWGMRTDFGPFIRGWSYAPVDSRVWDRFDPADPRREASIINTAAEGINVAEEGFQHTGFFGRKYTTLEANRWTGGGDYVLNWPNNYYAIRYADVLLMAAEMELLHGGSRDKAFEYYTQVRERALGAGNVGITASQLDLDRIYDERYFELCLEGHRYWDILRRGQDYAERTLSKTSSENFFGVTYDKTRAGLLPIPLYEIMQSKYTMNQNPGYN